MSDNSGTGETSSRDDAQQSKNESPDRESEEGFATSLEKAVKGVLDLSVGFFAAFWILTFKRSKLSRLIDPEDKASSTTIRPYTFLVLSALPGSIYYQAVAASLRSHSGTYSDVARNIGTLLLQEYSSRNILVLALPVVLVTALIASLLSRIANVKEDKKRRVMSAGSCLAFGFCFLCLAAGGALPLLLRALVPEQISPSPGLSFSNPLPRYAQLSGVPLAVYAVYSCGNILSRTAGYLGLVGSSVLGKTAYYLIGFLGINACLLAVFAFTIPHPERFLGADKVLKSDDSTVTCLGTTVYLSLDGTFTSTFLVRNDSEEVLHLLRAKATVVSDLSKVSYTEKWKPKALLLRSTVDNWGGGQSDVLVLKPGDESWLTISGVVPQEMVAFVRINQEIVGGKSIAVKSIILRHLGADAECGARDEVDKVRGPEFIVRTPKNNLPDDGSSK